MLTSLTPNMNKEFESKNNYHREILHRDFSTYFFKQNEIRGSTFHVMTNPSKKDDFSFFNLKWRMGSPRAVIA